MVPVGRAAGGGSPAVVLTVPFAWRRRLGHDASLLSALTRFVETVLAFYRGRGGILRYRSEVERTSAHVLPW